MKYYVQVKYNLCKVQRILYIDILVDQKGLICMYVVSDINECYWQIIYVKIKIW